MTAINLREYYPEYYKSDYIVEVPDEVAAAMLEYDRLEASYRRRVFYHDAHYSLDCGDGIEHEVLSLSPSLWEIYEHKVTMEQLHAALATLPDKQADRIYAHYMHGLPMTILAKNEGISVEAISASIQRGLRNLRKILKNFE